MLWVGLGLLLLIAVGCVGAIAMFRSIVRDLEDE